MDHRARLGFKTDIAAVASDLDQAIQAIEHFSMLAVQVSQT